MMIRDLFALALAAALPAQDPVADTQLPAQLRTAERALQRVTVDLERLVDMRLRHDLGLLAELDEDVVRVAGGASAREMDRMRGVLAELQARNTVLAGEYDAATRRHAELKTLAAGGGGAPTEADDFLPVPTVGDRVFGGVEDAAAYADAAQAPAAPAGEVRPAPLGDQELGALALDPIRVHIDGSDDDLCVARALFRAGQALMERGATLRRHGRADAARQLDERGYERLERALQHLKPVCEGADAPFVALFYESRCLELLFRFDERYPGDDGERLSLATDARRFNARAQEVRDPLLRITGPEEAGRASNKSDQAWREAAKTALENFRWMNIHAGYDARARIEAVTWPGERRQ